MAIEVGRREKDWKKFWKRNEKIDEEEGRIERAMVRKMGNTGKKKEKKKMIGEIHAEKTSCERGETERSGVL